MTSELERDDVAPEFFWSPVLNAPVWQDGGTWVSVKDREVIEIGFDGPGESLEPVNLVPEWSDWDRYQELTEVTKVYGDWSSEKQLAYAAMGLSNEAGEMVGELKKLLRDDDGRITPERRVRVINEGGDVLWYLTRALESVGGRLADAAEANIAKVMRRKDAGTLRGSGDR